MVTGIFKAEACFKVKGNKFYGDYTTTEVDTRTIVNEKYEGLVPPQNGIKLTVSTYDDDRVTFTIGKYYFTGEYKDEHDKDTLYTLGFGYKGHMYQITVDVKGELVRFKEWYNYGDFEDDNEPDNQYTKKSKDISWELVDL